MAYELQKTELDPLILGGCFFGSGGGGTVESARSLLAHFEVGSYYPRATVRVVGVDEALEGDTVMVAYLGSPKAIDGATYPDGPVQAVREIMDRLASQGRTLAYVVPPESGALGFIVACLVAAKLGLAVVDGDGAGRAVPSLPQLTYAAAEVNPRPAFLVSQSGLSVELDVKPRQGGNGGLAHQQDVSEMIDQMMRPIVSESDFAQFGGLAMWIMAPSVLAGALPIRGTLTRALDMGKALAERRFATATQVVAHLREAYGLDAQVIHGPGEFVKADTDTGGGFDIGRITLQGNTGTCTVVYQNESLMAWNSASPMPLCMAPDSIAYFVGGAGEPVFSNGDLVQADGSLKPALKHRTVTLIGIGADPALRKPGGLNLDSFMKLLKQMGYYGPYVALGARGGQA
ncbi:DUF917 domain-containing protein [Massilia niastensis]|uniref:DUF917 domain-containing protein n=1 Tax=Massilia niastensis TaxID=544911 RepID=UPI00035DF0E5|nr:DUF917 domain-containing protein [Massilia niastensis]